MRFLYLWLVVLLTIFPLSPAAADLRTPTWWDPDGVGVGQDWHYRIPISFPSGVSRDSTATVDVDFGAELIRLGIDPNSVTLDINSVRVIGPNNNLINIQQYTDSRFGGTTDTSFTDPFGRRGEVRWIVEQADTTHYIYFDITQNGAKLPNPQTPINGSFEQSSTGQTAPIGWNSPTATPGGDLQVRPNETVTVRDTDGSGQSRSTNGNANTGQFSLLLGYRTNPEPTLSGGNVNIQKLIRVPTVNPGTLSIRYKLGGWDTSVNSTPFAPSFGDYLRFEISQGGTPLIRLVDPRGNNYITSPFSPNLGSGSATTLQSGRGQYNGYDTTTTGTHTAGGTIANGAEVWLTETVSLAPLAGQSFSLLLQIINRAGFRSWVQIDDVEWSVVTGTAGAVEAFGADILSPNTLLTLTTGQSLPPITARVDARPTGPVTANLYDDSNMLRSSSLLFNDGAHGDGAANDAIWGNDGSDGANPLPSVPTTGVLPSLFWSLRIFARDNSTSSLGAANNGLAHRNGLPNEPTQTNYWNIDQIRLVVFPPDVRVMKSSRVVSDPISSANFKNIPGATVQYCMTILNNGGTGANNIIATDILPPNVSYRANSIRSGASCTTATTFEDDDGDDSDGADIADGVTASYNAGATTVTVNRATLTGGAEFAVTFEVRVD